MATLRMDRYFISLRLAQKFPWKRFKSISASRALGTMMHKRMGLAGPLLRGFVLTGPQKSILQFLKSSKLSCEFLIETKHGFCGLIHEKVSEAKAVTITDYADRIARAPTVAEEIKVVLTTLAQVSGYRFNVVVHQGPALPPFKKEEGVVNVVIGAAPPGAIDEAYNNVLCDVCLDARGHFIYRRIASPGQGIILRDTQDLSFAQVVDTTIYLLVPVTKFESFLLLDSVGHAGLFQKTFLPAWGAFVAPERHKKHKPRKIIDSDIYDKEMQLSLGIRREVVTTSIADKERMVADRLEKYLEALGQLASLYDLKRGIELREEEVFARLKDDYATLIQHPQIAAIEKVDEAIHFKTTMLYATHEGVRYRLGAYTIRYQPGNTVSLWAHEYAHKDLVAHPHISPTGVVCFGNVSQRVYEAAMHMNMVELVETIISWLTEGYTPELADTKIETWPKEEARAKLQPSR